MITNTQIEEFEAKLRTWRLRHSEDLDEVVSISLERYLKKQTSSRIQDPVAWLLTTAKFVRKELRRQTHKRQIPLLAYQKLYEIDRRANGTPMSKRNSAVTARAASPRASARETAVQHALAMLSPRERIVAEYCGIEDVKPAEVGRRLSLARSTVKSCWSRTKVKLEAMLKPVPK